jgi:hypothetical protein
LVSE